MALRHIALFTWNDDASPGEIAAIGEALSALPAAIPELRAYAFGPDAGVSDGNADYAVVADVDDAEAFAAYRDHPDHQAVLARIRPLLAARSAVQFTLP
ncbi:Dabb family protein [Nocardiopsis coralliicola]